MSPVCDSKRDEGRLKPFRLTLSALDRMGRAERVCGCDIFGLKLLPFRLLPKFPEQVGNDIDCLGHKCSKINAYTLALLNSR